MTKVKKFIYFIWDRKLTVSAAAMILAVTGLLSNILGLFRERLIAGHFGASHETDIFYASFKIPDLIFNLLILGALSSVFIPIFVEKLTSGEKEKAQRLANSLLNFILICALVFGVVVFILAPKLVPFLLPGFFNSDVNANLNTYETTVNLMRIMLLSPILLSIAGIFSGILNSHKRFVAYSLTPIVYNVSIILSMIFLIDKFDPQIYAPAVGVIGGALMQVFIQLPSVLRTGWRWRPIIDFQRGEVARMIKMIVPRTLAIGANQINIVVDTIILSFFVGGISVFHYANNIQTVPTVIFGIAIATAIFPALSENHAKNNTREFVENFSWSARRILFFMIPATIGIIVLRAQIVRLIFGIGNFDWEATYWTTKTLLFFSFGLIAQGLIPLLIRSFYAIQDTKNPFYIGVIVMVINAILSVAFAFTPALGLGVAGVALAFSIAGIVNAFLLFAVLHEKIGILDPDHKIFESTARLVIASVMMGAIVYASLHIFNTIVDTHKVAGLLLQTSGAVVIGGISYFLLTWLFKCEEIRFVLEKVRRK